MGQKVKTGDLIGWCDNTGISNGTHLHFECKPVKKIDGKYVNIYQNNGYFGAVRPNRFWNKRYAEDVKTFEEVKKQIEVLTPADAALVPWYLRALDIIKKLLNI